MEFCISITLGIGEGLLSHEVLGHLVQVRLRDLEVVPEDLVEPDAQAGNAGAGGFGFLIVGEPLLASGSRVAKLRESPRYIQAFA